MDRLIDAGLQVATQSSSHHALSESMNGRRTEGNQGWAGDSQAGLQVREQLKLLVDKSQWVYAAFWTPSEDKGTLVWKDGYYNGLPPAGLDVVIYEKKYCEIGMQCRKLVAEIQEITMTGDKHNTRLHIQPDELENTAWFYLMTMNFTFSLSDEFVGFCPGPAHTWNSGEHDWITGYNQMGDIRAQMALAAGLQTIVCVAVQSGVLEIGTTQMIPEDMRLVVLLRSVFNGEKDVRQLVEANEQLFNPAASLHASAVFAAAIAAAVAAQTGKNESEQQEPNKKAVTKWRSLGEESETGSSSGKDTKSQSVTSKATSGCRSPCVSSVKLQNLVDHTQSVLTIVPEDCLFPAGKDQPSVGLSSCKRLTNLGRSQTLKTPLPVSQEDISRGRDLRVGSATWWEELPAGIVDNLPLHDEVAALPSLPSCMPPKEVGSSNRWPSRDSARQENAKELVAAKLDVADEWDGITASQGREDGGQEEDLVREGDLLLDLADLELPFSKDSLDLCCINNSLSDPFKDWPWYEHQSLVGDEGTHPFLTTLMTSDQLPEVSATSFRSHDDEKCTTLLHMTASAQHSGTVGQVTDDHISEGVSHDGVSNSAQSNSKLAQSALTSRARGNARVDASIDGNQTANLLVDRNTALNLSIMTDPSGAKSNRHSCCGGMDDLDHGRRPDYTSNGLWSSHRPEHHHEDQQQLSSNGAVVHAMNGEQLKKETSRGNFLNPTDPLLAAQTKMKKNVLYINQAAGCAAWVPELTHAGGTQMTVTSVASTIQGIQSGTSHVSQIMSPYSQPVQAGQGSVTMLIDSRRPRQQQSEEEPAAKRVKLDKTLASTSFPKFENHSCVTFASPKQSSPSSPIVRTRMPPPPVTLKQQQPQPQAQAQPLQQPAPLVAVHHHHHHQQQQQQQQRAQSGFLIPPSMTGYGCNVMLQPTSPVYSQSSFSHLGERKDDLSVIRNTLPTSTLFSPDKSIPKGKQCLPGDSLPGCGSAEATFAARLSTTTCGCGLDSSSSVTHSSSIPLRPEDASVVTRRSESVAVPDHHIQESHHIGHRASLVPEGQLLPSGTCSSSSLRPRQLGVNSSGAETHRNNLDELISGPTHLTFRWGGDLRAMTMSAVTSSGSWEKQSWTTRRLNEHSNTAVQLASSSASGLDSHSFNCARCREDHVNGWGTTTVSMGNTSSLKTGYSSQDWCNRLSTSRGATMQSSMTSHCGLMEPAMQSPSSEAPATRVKVEPQRPDLSTRELISCLPAVNLRQFHHQGNCLPSKDLATTRTMLDSVCLDIPSHVHHMRLSEPLLSTQTEASSATLQSNCFHKGDLEQSILSHNIQAASHQLSPTTSIRAGAATAALSPLGTNLANLPNFQPRCQEGNNGAFELSEIMSKRIPFDTAAAVANHNIMDWPWGEAGGMSNGGQLLLHGKKRKWTVEALARAILKTRPPSQSLASPGFPNLWCSADDISVTT